MDWLKEIRLAKKMTGKDVAEKVSVTPQYYNAIELGKRRPSPEKAMALGALLGFHWTKFFEDGTEPTEHSGCA